MLTIGIKADNWTVSIVTKMIRVGKHSVKALLKSKRAEHKKRITRGG
jgi:hypothetical protein